MKVRRHLSEEGADHGRLTAPATVLKKISALRSFFSYAHGSLQATKADPTSQLTDRAKGLVARKSRLKNSYLPFDDAQLQLIFDPVNYLTFNRDADFFWAPLIGLHMGCRLGEIVTLKLDAIWRDEETGAWVLEIKDEHAKNSNSIRKVPVPNRLIRLGFLRYVRHLQVLGAESLFPHRDMGTPTAQLNPSKACTRKFADYLDTLSLTDTALVFHSFRHTVVSALHDGGTPEPDSTQIVGHAAQEYAIAKGLASARQMSGSHARYVHADSRRMNVAHPMLRLKSHLDRSILPPLDYRRLRKAADIVLTHTRAKQGGTGFRSGWSALKTDHTAAMVDQLR